MPLGPALLLLGLVANTDTACPRATLHLPQPVRVYVGAHQGSPDDPGAVEDMRQTLRCHAEAFTVVTEPSEADLDVLILSREHLPRNPAWSQYQMGVSVAGTRILPGTLVTGGPSWEDCYRDLARGLVQLLGAGQARKQGATTRCRVSAWPGWSRLARWRSTTSDLHFGFALGVYRGDGTASSAAMSKVGRMTARPGDVG